MDDASFRLALRLSQAACPRQGSVPLGNAFTILSEFFASVSLRMRWVLFFDGECGFCNRLVHILAKLDRRKVVYFAPLQGQLAATHHLARYAEKGGGSMVLLRQPDDKIFTHSDACIELARALGGIWNLTIIAKWIPKAWRDAAYSFIARNRHWLSRHFPPTCQLPTADLAERFID